MYYIPDITAIMEGTDDIKVRGTNQHVVEGIPCGGGLEEDRVLISEQKVCAVDERGCQNRAANIMCDRKELVQS